MRPPGVGKEQRSTRKKIEQKYQGDGWNFRRGDRKAADADEDRHRRLR